MDSNNNYLIIVCSHALIFQSNANNFQIDLLDWEMGLTGTITLDQSGFGSNSNEKVLHTLQSSRTSLGYHDKVSLWSRKWFLKHSIDAPLVTKFEFPFILNKLIE